MKAFKETKDLYRYQGGVEIELHQRYGDLEPYDIHEAETYFTGKKMYICRCIHCGRVMIASRENLLYGNQIHCGCVGEKIDRGYYELDQLDNFDYLQMDIQNTGRSSAIRFPFKPDTKEEFEESVRKFKEDIKNKVTVELEDGSFMYVTPEEAKNYK